MSVPLFEKVAFIGLGLIGSSLARVMIAEGLTQNIVASTRSEKTLQDAKALGLIQQGYSDPVQAVQGADLVVLALPVRATQKVLETIKPYLQEHTIITDVGSTKGNVVDAAKAVYGEALPAGFVPGHPIAGAEHTGVYAGKVDLFANHKVILTPLPTSADWAVEKLIQLWQAAKAEVICMDVAKHDEVLAHTSHLPHLMAFNLVEQLANREDNLDIFRYAAGGFRDFSRIAASDPQMWHDIFFANKKAILNAVDGFENQLATIRKLIEDEDSHALMGLLGHAQAARQHFNHMLAQKPFMESNKVTTQQFTILPGKKSFQGKFSVPGDKSVSHRSIMFGAIAEGTTHVTGFLEGEDALATLQAFRDMGVSIEGPKNGEVTIHGVGVNGLKAPASALYMGNSGTSMRLLSGMLSAQKFDSVMTGDASLSKRPMERIAKPLREMGAQIQTTGERGTPPVSITGNQALQGIHYDLPMASAQVKSGILLAGLWAAGETSVTEPEPTRDHTERMLRAFGYDVKTEGNRISLQGGGKLVGTEIQVPSDISSAAFFMVGAAITEGSDVTLEAVGINPTRTGVIEILKQMGADITVENERIAGGEPIADIRIQGTRTLKGIHMPEDQVPLAIDEFPALFIAAACAEGQTVLTGAAELRVKESDRIQVMADGLKTMGIDCTPTDDGIIIEGKGHSGEWGAIFTGGEIESHHDHRIAMSFSMAGLRTSGEIKIIGTETVATSFPTFTQLSNQAGLAIQVTE
ncbi:MULTISPECIES: bifunctional prephenate dehydrogenase/3-phosphoshikimate 1-carboxyvinyltransferase [Acinetobacter]|jgi:cyclohexadieny/prephenate dehydrogenase / 3-phosphoshikimate 1-carboxyvinyltransferase|uniref:3-phosphoshikimate 1-carboxyvinyltransferase n=4 Tax=Acinetobacter TaxID=469 RepID=A0AAJ6IGQ9_ACIJO|nr:bifunctional prephenate dehydrogenase/3-phosphoshikimate 1-carboxyvinyltransferase [Acinetobacter johnsonii]MBO7705006.1 bifunctional prephenate dehydrogenase/3-phosphoshikimate 1-carboxyvinyltransferase [Acinetobacter sp.]ALV72356.1 3-phosphoshikimate 1-carboxyvinyltransferase [Acinetobacter johnsonii XBB1]MCV2450693.1 bifunctional prephenate dehydrogenase/3-phosphoshikimate 1-carboxyvinyltransferase [Acinetobacter johnsonii]MDG9786093.1 bifunctional prephenate dehydrogenase/3-phosphoshikim